MPKASKKNKKTLKKLIQMSAVLPKADKAILLSRLDKFLEKKVNRLLALFQSEQKKIADFGVQAEQIQMEYHRTLEKDKQNIREKIEQDENKNAETILDESLKHI